MIEKYQKEKLQGRRSIRLRDYDYSQAGAYFVTICTKEREPLLGQVVSDVVVLTQIGQVVSLRWVWLGQQYPYVELDQWIVMPNHLHGIITINRRGGSRTATTKVKTLGRLVGAFKTVSTKRVNELRDTLGIPLWQRNYYEHIIRDDDELNRIRQYITYNPTRWAEDENNPTNFPIRDLHLQSQVGAIRELPYLGGSRTAPTLICQLLFPIYSCRTQDIVA